MGEIGKIKYGFVRLMYVEFHEQDSSHYRHWSLATADKVLEYPEERTILHHRRRAQIEFIYSNVFTYYLLMY